MMKLKVMFMFLVIAFAVRGLPSVARPEFALTQDELESLTMSEGLRVIHGCDWMSWVKSCRNRGVTDDMFTAVLSKIACQTMDAEEGSEDDYKCKKALSAMAEFAVSNGQLTNVLHISRNSNSRSIRAAAAFTYYRLTKGTDAFLAFSETMLLATNVYEEVECEIMSGLYNDAKVKHHENGGWKNRAVRLMHIYLKKDARALSDADQILKWCDVDYVNSSLRKEVVKRILAPEHATFLQKHKGRYGQELLKQYHKENKQ